MGAIIGRNMGNGRIMSWESITRVAILICSFLVSGCFAANNLPPYFTDDMNNHVIPENTPVGTAIYTLKGVDPEGSPLKYGLMGTDRLRVDEKTGIVTVVKPIDREVSDRLKVSVTVEDVVRNGIENNVVTIPVSVTISDTNDNAPTFIDQGRYENIQVIEDMPVGTKIVGIDLRDLDLTGMTLDVSCTPSPQSPDACEVFPVEVKDATAGHLKGEVQLGKPLNFNKRSLYQFQLTASDGEHKSKVSVLIRVKDVQNTPPVFTGAMAGRIMEDSVVGTLVMHIQARDGDLGKPRDVRLILLSNPGDVFQLDSKSGKLTTARPLDRETLGSILTLQIQATEIPSEDSSLFINEETDILTTVKNITVLIDDVNDSEPTFNKKEYVTEITENMPVGTPLPELDMVVTDTDTGTFADFTLRIDGPLADHFDIQPKFASGSVRPVIRVKKVFDHENPNERQFILLLIAQNTDEPELFSTATVTVTTIDENDNRPWFDRDVYTISIPENIKPGTTIGQIVAEDPDQGDFGNDGLLYQLIGSGSKRFVVSNRTGHISIAECGEPTNCLDYETQKTFDLLYMASDNNKEEGFLKSVVPVQISLLDANDNPVYFEEEEEMSHIRTLKENTAQFEPPFFIKAKDKDETAAITYQIITHNPNSSILNFFEIDSNTGEITIRHSENLPPSNYSFRVEASDGLFKAVTPVFIQVNDINNHYPAWTQKTMEHSRVFNLSEDVAIGSIIASVKATDQDLRENGLVRYTLEKGAYGHFEIDDVTGDVTLTKEISFEETPSFELIVTAFDQGSPPLRSTTTIHVNVVNVYIRLPRMTPSVQRVQVSESAEPGEIITTLATNVKELGLNLSESNIQFDFVDPIEVRNVDNKQLFGAGVEMAREWFRIDHEGRISVSSSLQRELVTAINFTVMITSERSRPGSKHLGSLMITIFEVNDKPPTVEDMEIEILEELPPGQAILTIEAEDPEGGQISHYYMDQGAAYFSVDNKTGEVKVAGRLDYEQQQMYNLTVVAVDSGVPQLSSTATIMVSLVNDNDNDPKFDKNEYETILTEHPAEGTVVTKVSASDADVDSTITYEILSSPFSSAFSINRLGEISVSKEGSSLIDRDAMPVNQPVISLNIKASDGERVGYTSVRIFIQDLNDIPPKFEQKTYHITAHAPLRAKQEILRVPASGGDLPHTDRLHFAILAGNDEGIFEIDQESGVIRAVQGYQRSGEVNLQVQVSDAGPEILEGHIDTTNVVIQILPGNFKKPEFLFPNKINSTLVALESDAQETERFSNSDYTKALGQVMAFDPDEGDAGKVQFYFKEGDNLVTDTDRFRIESETGKILQIRELDREGMNKYDLVVVAKDSGVPVSTQSQHILTVQIQDIDDHKPFFKNRHYNFKIRENSLENTFIGQVQAEDEDEGKNAQIFYFLVSEGKDVNLKEDIRVDIKTGMIHSNAVLDRERLETYKLYVRATSSPIINRTMQIMSPEEWENDFSLASLNITVLDENDNSPRFTEKQYFAAINSDAEPGREILTLSAVDIDSSQISPIQYSLHGANLILDDFKSGGSVIPSPFKVDAQTGRLTLSQSAMRQYSSTGGNNRFQVKVGVRETVPPYHSDTSHVQVWVVESSQETVLTVKTPPTTLLKDALVDILTNITGSYVLITKISPHVNLNDHDEEEVSVNKEWSDIYVVAIDKGSFQTVPVSQFLQALDLGHDRLKNAEHMPIILHTAVPAMTSLDGEGGGEYYFNRGDTFDAAFAGLIALIALLCMGIAAIVACCCCINRMYDRDADSEKQTIYGGMKYPLDSSHTSIPGTPVRVGGGGIVNPNNSSDMMEDMATDNPLWIDHKLKTYEEQELTMQVASELDHSNGSVDIDDDGGELEDVDEEDEDMMMDLSIRKRQRTQSPQFSHAYATLHPHPLNRDRGDEYDMLGDDTIAVHL